MWKDSAKRQKAAAALKYTAPEVRALGCVDDVVAEPEDGDPGAAVALLAQELRKQLSALETEPVDTLLEQRYAKFRNIAQFYTSDSATAQ